jgi:DnaK suppressor protein
MDVAIYRDALLRKKDELLGGNAIKPLQWTMENNSGRQGDVADQAAGTNEVHIQLKLKQTDAKILQAIEEALHRVSIGTYGLCRDCDGPIAEARLKAIAPVCPLQQTPPTPRRSIHNAYSRRDW